MRISVRFFARLRELVGAGRREWELPPGSTVRELWLSLCAAFPSLADYGEGVSVALNAEHASWESPLREGDEVAFLPPVSGGRMPFLRLSEEPIEVGQVIAGVAAPECGAVAVFLGTVRHHSRGRRVQALEYEAYPEMALREMERICREIRRRWGLERVAIVHRLGRLEVGEVSLVIAVAAPHRAEAFQACRHAIERLKESVPIWKKEIGEGGEVWVEGSP